MKRTFFFLTVVCGMVAVNMLGAQRAPQVPTPQPPPRQAGAGTPAAKGANQAARGGERPQPLAPPPAVMPPPAPPIVSMTTPSPDPRVGLPAGLWTAGQAAWNMRMISTTPPSPDSD